MDQTIDYGRSVRLPVFGIVVPVTPPPHLIEYGGEAGWLDRSAASSPGPDS